MPAGNGYALPRRIQIISRKSNLRLAKYEVRRGSSVRCVCSSASRVINYELYLTRSRPVVIYVCRYIRSRKHDIDVQALEILN